MDTSDAITKKVGPLPAWAWAGTVVVLVLLFRHFQQSAASAQDTTADPAQTDLTAPANDPTGDPFSGGGFTGSTGDPAASVPDTATTDALGGILDAVTNQGDTLSDISSTLNDIADGGNQTPAEPKPKHTTRNQWAMAGVSDVTGHGHSPLEVETAMYRYLHGKPLTPEQRKIVNEAIRKNGPPPGGVIPVVHSPKPLGQTKDAHHSKQPAHKPAKKAPPRKKKKVGSRG